MFVACMQQSQAHVGSPCLECMRAYCLLWRGARGAEGGGLSGAQRPGGGCGRCGGRRGRCGWGAKSGWLSGVCGRVVCLGPLGCPCVCVCAAPPAAVCTGGCVSLFRRRSSPSSRAAGAGGGGSSALSVACLGSPIGLGLGGRGDPIEWGAPLACRRPRGGGSSRLPSR